MVSLPAIGRELDVAVRIEERLDQLHEMLYRRGGVRPVNAAIEELTKLLLLEVVRRRDPSFDVGGGLTLGEAIDPQRILAAGHVENAKAAFTSVISHKDVVARVPDGTVAPLWPLDEPLRITRADVLAEAVAIVSDAVDVATASDDRYDPLGTAFDVFLRGRYDHAGGLATHLTPHTVVTHLARLCLHELDVLSRPISGPVLGDPCCGTGRFILAVVRELRSRLNQIDPTDPERLRRERALARVQDEGLFGADQSSSSVAKARVNLLLHGIAHPFVFTARSRRMSAATLSFR